MPPRGAPGHVAAPHRLLVGGGAGGGGAAATNPRAHLEAAAAPELASADLDTLTDARALARFLGTVPPPPPPPPPLPPAGRSPPPAHPAHPARSLRPAHFGPARAPSLAARAAAVLATAAPPTTAAQAAARLVAEAGPGAVLGVPGGGAGKKRVRDTPSRRLTADQARAAVEAAVEAAAAVARQQGHGRGGGGGGGGVGDGGDDSETAFPLARVEDYQAGAGLGGPEAAQEEAAPGHIAHPAAAAWAGDREGVAAALAETSAVTPAGAGDALAAVVGVPEHAAPPARPRGGAAPALARPTPRRWAGGVSRG